MNGTRLTPSGCLSSSNSTAGRIAETFGYCLIFVVSFSGNTFIGIIVYKTKAMRKTINFLIVNMAMSDLVMPISFISLILAQVNHSSWPIRGALGMATCKLVQFLPNVSIAVSIQSLLLIAVDRFGAVVFPLRSPIISSKLCPYLILTTWIAAIILFSPHLIGFELVEYPGRLACELRWKKAFGETSDNRIYLIILLLLLVCIPFCLIIILYTSIFVKLKSQNHIGEPSSNAEQQRLKRHRNVLRMAIAIVLGFAICWAPLSSYYFYFLHSHPRDGSALSCGVISNWSTVGMFLAYTNCAINPCICFAFSENYRQHLWSLLKCVGEYLGLIFQRSSNHSSFVVSREETAKT